MMIKKIYAKDARSEMQKLKSECVDEAVILSNCKTADGVELIIGEDFDQDIINSIGEKVRLITGRTTNFNTTKSNEIDSTGQPQQNYNSKAVIENNTN